VKTYPAFIVSKKGTELLSIKGRWTLTFSGSDHTPYDLPEQPCLLTLPPPPYNTVGRWSIYWTHATYVADGALISKGPVFAGTSANFSVGTLLGATCLITMPEAGSLRFDFHFEGTGGTQDITTVPHWGW